MDVIIDSECALIPEETKPLITQRNPLLNFLISQGYEGARLPLADLLARYHHLEGRWIILTPIYWQATHNNAMIVGAGDDLGISDERSRFFFERFAEYLKVEDITLYYHDASTWLLSAKDMPLLNSPSAYQLLNHPLLPELTALDSTMHWQKFFTESQMFFASQFNEAEMNGVWMCGSDELIIKNSRKIATNQEFKAFADICSQHVSIYSPTVNIHSYDVLLLNSLDELTDIHQQELKKAPVNWYWNNTAYSKKRINWFTRFWRTFRHAD